MAGRGEIAPYTTAHRREERAQRLAILEGPGQCRQHTIYIGTVSVAAEACESAAKGLYIYIMGIYTVVSEWYIVVNGSSLHLSYTYISMHIDCLFSTRRLPRSLSPLRASAEGARINFLGDTALLHDM